jgi:glycosyltransferase involved in cell wall biosynthesis
MASNAENAPIVSVLMPVWNAERFLAAAVQSVLDQTQRELELIAVDDASTDGSLRILQSFAAKDPRVRVFQNEQNQQIVKTRNRAFREADPRSRYFAIMDSDDVCMPERLAEQLRFLDAHPDHALVGSRITIIDEQGRDIGRRDYPCTHEAIARVLTRYNPFAQSSVTLRRSALEEVGHYDERYTRCQDYDLWFRMAARFRVANLEQALLAYRISETQGKTTHLRQTLRLSLEIRRRWLFDPRFASATNTAHWALQHGLYVLPEPVTLALFKAVTFRRRA